MALAEALDILTAGIELDELLQECVDAQHHVVLDVSNVRFIDSGALALLSRASRNLRDSGRTLVLLHPHSKLEEEVDITGLGARIALARNWEDAIALLGPEPTVRPPRSMRHSDRSDPTSMAD